MDSVRIQMNCRTHSEHPSRPRESLGVDKRTRGEHRSTLNVEGKESVSFLFILYHLSFLHSRSNNVVPFSLRTQLSQGPSRLHGLDLLHRRCSRVKAIQVSGSPLLRTSFRICCSIWASTGPLSVASPRAKTFRGNACFQESFF